MSKKVFLTNNDLKTIIKNLKNFHEKDYDDFSTSQEEVNKIITELESYINKNEGCYLDDLECGSRLENFGLNNFKRGRQSITSIEEFGYNEDSLYFLQDELEIELDEDVINKLISPLIKKIEIDNIDNLNIFKNMIHGSVFFLNHADFLNDVYEMGFYSRKLKEILEKEDETTINKYIEELNKGNDIIQKIDDDLYIHII